MALKFFVHLPSQKYYMQQGHDEDLVYLGFFPFVATVLSLGLSIGVVVALGSLLFIQVSSVDRLSQPTLLL